MRKACELCGCHYEGNFWKGLSAWQLDPEQLSAGEREQWQRDPSAVVSGRLLQLFPELLPYRGARTWIPARPNMPEDFYYLSALAPSSAHLVADGIQNEVILRNQAGAAWRGFNPDLACFPSSVDIWCPDYLARDTAGIGNARILDAAVLSAVYEELARSSLGSHLEKQLMAGGKLPDAIVLSQHFALSRLCSEEEEFEYYSSILNRLREDGARLVLFKRHPRDPAAKTERLMSAAARTGLPVISTDDLASCVPIECLKRLWADQEAVVVGSSSSAVLGLQRLPKVRLFCADGSFLPEPLRRQILLFSTKNNIPRLTLDGPAVAADPESAPVEAPSAGSILFVSHEATRTGAPVYLLHLLRWLRANTDLRFRVLLGRGGPLESEFHALAETFTPETFGTDGSRLADVDCIYSNTCTNGALIDSLGCGHIPVVTHVHELDYVIDLFGRRISTGSATTRSISSPARKPLPMRWSGGTASRRTGFRFILKWFRSPTWSSAPARIRWRVPGPLRRARGCAHRLPRAEPRIGARAPICFSSLRRHCAGGSRVRGRRAFFGSGCCRTTIAAGSCATIARGWG